MKYETLIVERDGALLDITLNRPERLNAMDPTMFEELVLVADAAAAPDIRGVFLHGAGRAFCSGADLVAGAGTMSLGVLEFRSYVKHINSVVSKLHRLEKPVVAAVHGPAAGAGCNLALSADIRYVSEEGYFMEVFTKRGLVPDFGGLWLLPRLVGLGRAKEIMFSARKVMGPEAVNIGLANKLCPQDTVIADGRALAKELSEGPTQAFALAKAGLNQAMDCSLEQILDYEASLQAMVRTSGDTMEAGRAFVEKRTPTFAGK